MGAEDDDDRERPVVEGPPTDDIDLPTNRCLDGTVACFTSTTPSADGPALTLALDDDIVIGPQFSDQPEEDNDDQYSNYGNEEIW